MTEHDGEKFLAALDRHLAGGAGSTSDDRSDGAADLARFGARLARAVGCAAPEESIARLRARLARGSAPGRELSPRPSPWTRWALGAAAAAVTAAAALAALWPRPAGDRRPPAIVRGVAAPEAGAEKGPRPERKDAGTAPPPAALSARPGAAPAATGPAPERIVIPAPAPGTGAGAPMALRPYQPSEAVLPDLLASCDLVVEGKVATVSPPPRGERYGRAVVSVSAVWWSRRGGEQEAAGTPREIDVPYDTGEPRVGAIPPGGWAPPPPAPKPGAPTALLVKADAQHKTWAVLADLADRRQGGDDPYDVKAGFTRAWCALRNQPEGPARFARLIEMLKSGEPLAQRAAVAFAAAEWKPADPAGARDLAECLMDAMPRMLQRLIRHGSKVRPPDEVTWEAVATATSLLGRHATADHVARLSRAVVDRAADGFARRQFCRALGACPRPEAAAQLKAAFDAVERELESGRSEIAEDVLSALASKPADADLLPRIAALLRHPISLGGALAPYGLAAVPHVGRALLEFDPQTLGGHHPGDHAGYLSSAIAAPKSSVGIPYLLAASLRPIPGSYSAKATARGIEALLSDAPEGAGPAVTDAMMEQARLAAAAVGRAAGRRIWIEDGEPAPAGDPEALLPARMAAWERKGAAALVADVKALPERERRMFEAQFRTAWADSTAAGAASIRWIALRACALALAAKGRANWAPEDAAFVRSLVAELDRATAAPAEEIRKRLAALGDEDVEAREAASKALDAMGLAAAPYLAAARNAADAEVASRAAAIAHRTRALDIAAELRKTLAILSGLDADRSDPAAWARWLSEAPAPPAKGPSASRPAPRHAGPSASRAAPDKTPLLYDRARAFGTIVVARTEKGFESNCLPIPNTNCVRLPALAERVIKGPLQPGPFRIDVHHELPGLLARRDGKLDGRYLLVLAAGVCLGAGHVQGDLERFLPYDASLDRVARAFADQKDETPEGLLRLCAALLGDARLTEGAAAHVHPLLLRVLEILPDVPARHPLIAAALAPALERARKGLDVEAAARTILAADPLRDALGFALYDPALAEPFRTWLDRSQAEPVTPWRSDHDHGGAMRPVIEVLGRLKDARAGEVLSRIARDPRWRTSGAGTAAIAALPRVLGKAATPDLRRMLAEFDKPPRPGRFDWDGIRYNAVVDALASIGEGEGLRKKEVRQASPPW